MPIDWTKEPLRLWTCSRCSHTFTAQTPVCPKCEYPGCYNTFHVFGAVVRGRLTIHTDTARLTTEEPPGYKPPF